MPKSSSTAAASAGKTTEKKSTKASTGTKTYVLDTSVLLSDPWACTRFAEHEVVVPLVVITELEAKKAELDSQIKAASPKDAEGEDGEAAEAAEDDGDEENAVDEAQLKAWKKELTAVKKQLKAKNDSFKQHIASAVDGLTPEAAADLLLTILHNDMQAIVERYMSAQRKHIVAAFENWWDKYRVTLTEIEVNRDAAALALQGFLKGLRYV